MNKKVITLATAAWMAFSSLQGASAHAYDVFFHGEGHRFVKTDIVQVDQKPYVLFSTCEVKNLKLALCLDRVLVSQHKILKGTTTNLVAGYGAGTFFAGLSVGTGALILSATGGNPFLANALGFGLFGTSLMGSVFSADLLVDTYRFHQVVADSVALDLNHSVRLVSYSEFLNTLLKATSTGGEDEMFSLREDSLKPSREEPYLVEMNAEQIQWLKLVSGEMK